MEHLQRNAYGEQSTRRARLTIGALGILAILIAGIVALFSLYYADQGHRQTVQTLQDLDAASREAGAAQVAFKRQVQEWKNLLLRGHDAQDYARYRDAMQAQSERVEAALAALSRAPATPAALTERASVARALHGRIQADYEAAAAAFEEAGRQNPVAVDARVRGVDRGLDQALDALAEQLRAALGEALQEARVAAERRYEALRKVVLFAHGLGIGLLTLLLLLALRDPVGRGPAARG
ncbi:hypothetical protein [Aquibaculum sediminis]|uniref:hypothetical protein n=1 Tax=Aquibaculum sediminis TaxID=3231907 RepID=UPI003452FCF5